MRTKKTNQNLLTLSILSTIVVFLWIGLEIYYILRQPVKIEVNQKHLKTLNPSFDKEVVESLKKRSTFSENEIKNAPDFKFGFSYKELEKTIAEIQKESTTTATSSSF